MKNHKGKPVYTFDGCIAIMKVLNEKERREFANQHRDLFSDSEKLAQVLDLLHFSHVDEFLSDQEAYWEEEFVSEESAEILPLAKKAKPSSAAMFQSNVAKVHIGSDNDDEHHHSRRNGHM